MSGKLKAVLVLGIMYGLGVVSGVAWYTYHGHHFMTEHAYFAEHRIKRLTSQLHLSPAQEQEIRDIFRDAHARAAEINEEVSWDLADVHRDSVQAIRKILIPDQVREFDKLHQRYHARHKRLPDEQVEAVSTAPAKAAP